MRVELLVTFGNGKIWNEGFSFGKYVNGEFKSEKSFNFLTRCEFSSDNDKTSKTYGEINYDSSGYMLTGPLSKAFGMIKVIVDSIGEEELKKQVIQELLTNFSRYKGVTRDLCNIVPKEISPDKKLPIDDEKVLVKIKKNPAYKILINASQKFEKEIEKQRNEIVFQDEERKKSFSDSLDKYRINPTTIAPTIHSELHKKDEPEEDVK